MKTSEFTKKTVAELTGETPRTIHFWTDFGLIVPELDNPKGRGKNRKYSEKNVFEFLLVRQLVKFGLSLENIKNIMPFVREGGINREGKWADIMRHQKAYLIIWGPTDKKAECKFIFSNTSEKKDIHLDMKKCEAVIVMDLKWVVEKMKSVLRQ